MKICRQIRLMLAWSMAPSLRTSSKHLKECREVKMVSAWESSALCSSLSGVGRKHGRDLCDYVRFIKQVRILKYTQ